MEDTRQWDKILKVLKEKDNNQEFYIHQELRKFITISIALKEMLKRSSSGWNKTKQKKTLDSLWYKDVKTFSKGKYIGKYKNLYYYKITLFIF